MRVLDSNTQKKRGGVERNRERGGREREREERQRERKRERERKRGGWRDSNSLVIILLGTKLSYRINLE